MRARRVGWAFAVGVGGAMAGNLPVANKVSLAGSDTVAARAARPDMSCAFFSPIPDDRAGPPLVFVAQLSADEQSAVTESPGAGRVEFTLDRQTLTLSWRIQFSALTSRPIGLHVHGPQTPGAEAGILFDLLPASAVRSQARGSKVLDDGLLGYLVQDRLYVNLHTRKYPAGELRGPIRKQRPNCSQRRS